MPPKNQRKGVTVSATRRSTRAAGRAMVSGSNTPGASAKVATVGGSKKTTAVKRVRVGQHALVAPRATLRRNDSSSCSEEAMDRPESTTRKNQLRSTSTVANVDGSTSSDEVSDSERNAVLSPQGREPFNVGISRRADLFKTHPAMF